MVTVLIVDDPSTDRLLATGLLKKSDTEWQIYHAIDGKDALDKIEMHVPDIVITDMQMPEMNGLELVTAATLQYPLIPFILMTSQGSEKIAVEALQTGAASYVPKRLLAADLQLTVERVLAMSGKDRQRARLKSRIKQQRVELELEMDLSLIAASVNYLQQLVAESHHCNESDQLRLGVALEEALVNAYYHGNLGLSSDLRDQEIDTFYSEAAERVKADPYCYRKVFIQADITAEEMRFQICDEGEGFDPSLLPDATDPENLIRPCGRGILLMRTFMDDVIFNDCGNVVTLIKRQPEQE